MAEVRIEGRVLDVFEGLDFSFNYGISDVRDPNKRSTEYTKTIKCPSTPNNDRLFGQIYDVNISNDFNPNGTNIEVNFNPNKKASAVVTSNGVEVMSGVVQLRKVSINQSKYNYEVVFIGKLKNIFSVLGDNDLNGLDDNGLPLIDFSDLDHFLSKSVVEASWNNTTGYVYPMIDYGLSYEFDNQGRRIYDVDVLRPAVYLKDVIDRLFAFADFNYTSTFFGSTFFKRLIVPWYSQSFTLTDAQITARQFVAESTSQLSVITGMTSAYISNNNMSFKRLSFADFTDPSNQWNDSLFEYSPTAIGYYKFTTTASFTVTRIDVNQFNAEMSTTLVLNRRRGNVDTVIDTLTFDIDIPDSTLVGQSATTAINFESQQHLLYIGDTVWVEVWVDDAIITVLNNDFTIEMNTGSRFFNTVVEEQVFENADVYMNNFVPRVGMAELLLSVFKMFNLYVEQNPLNDRNLLIETRATYYANAPVIDWTYKMARDKEISLEPLGLLTAREYVYTYSDDEDYYNSRYKDLRGHTYGRRKRDTDNDFIDNTNTVEVVFSPTPLVNDGNSNRLIPKIYDADIEEGRKPTDINIRVLYYAGLIPSNPLWIYRYNAGNTTEVKAAYPYAGHLDNPITPTVDLSFGIPSELFYTSNGYISQLQYTNANLFNIYHRDYIEEITNKDSKVMTAMFWLSPIDISNLNFRSQVIIDNCYWRLNKVMNYNPFKEGLTKVELIKIKEAVTFVKGNFVNGSSGTIGSGKDIEKHPFPTSPTTLGGNISPFNGTVKGIANVISQSATAFNVLGSNNYIGAGSTNITIQGNNNTITEGASNVVIINTNGAYINDSNVTYVNGVISYDINIADGGEDNSLPLSSKSLVRVMDGGVDIVQEINIHNLTNLVTNG